MIKLSRLFTPLCLNPKTVSQLTADFIAQGRNVWNVNELKLALLKTSHDKCAYCECNLSKESNYMEVEHFFDKTKNPTQVLDWDNLLPSCKRCNVAKGAHNTRLEPIVNPYNIDPKDHLTFKVYRLKAKTKLGESTIAVLDLNNHHKVVSVRFELGEKIIQSLQTALDYLDKFKSDQSSRNRNKLVSLIKGILNEAQEHSEYAATSASVLVDDENYIFLVKELKVLALWDSELDTLDLNARSIALN